MPQLCNEGKSHFKGSEKGREEIVGVKKTGDKDLEQRSKGKTTNRSPKARKQKTTAEGYAGLCCATLSF